MDSGSIIPRRIYPSLPHTYRADAHVTFIIILEPLTLITHITMLDKFACEIHEFSQKLSVE